MGGRMTRFFLFDLDGTVLDTLGTIAYYANGALVKNGVEPIEKEQYKYLVGRGIANLVRSMLEYRSVYSDELYERVYHDYDTAYNADVAYGTEIYPEMKETLDELRARGCRLAIVSNKPDFAARTVVNATFGEGYFDFVTGQKEGAPFKPDPTVVNAVIDFFGAERAECVYVGDTGGDMKTAKNAGVRAVGVLWGFRDREELLENGADLLLSGARELLDIE